MPERIYKLQPDRTIQLRGFNDLGASAAMHSATPDSFKVSGVFRDPADFCVLSLYDADNFFEHPSLRYLPDTNFDGLTLSFDVHYTGLRPLDSPRHPIVDWPLLDVIRPDRNGTTGTVKLFDHARLVSGSWTPARAQFTVIGTEIQQWDHLTIWYLSRAFDVLIDNSYKMSIDVTNASAKNPPTESLVHTVTVQGVDYSYEEIAGEWDGTIAQRLLEQLAACPYVDVTRSANTLELQVKSGIAGAVTITSTEFVGTQTISQASAESVAAEIARQCNETNWHDVGADIPITAVAEGAVLTFTATKAGVDGNALAMYAVSKNNHLTTDKDFVQFSGGSSDAIWNVSIDFKACGIPDIRKAWLTFAPDISAGKAYEATEWEATFTNWRLEGPENLRKLDVAGPGSFRIEPYSGSCTLDGSWADEHGFYSRAYAKVSKAANNKVTISYEAGSVHEIWLGTSLYSDRGVASVTLDGRALDDFDAYLNTKADPAVVTRRPLATGVSAGAHTLTLTTLDSRPFYFDYLDIVVRGDIPARLDERTNISPALDYSTDHTYKLPPARILWMFDQLGFAGPMNEYIGVFWWNQRKRVGPLPAQATLTFTGEFKYQDEVWLNVSGTNIGKGILATDSGETIARHFAAYANAKFVGLWAEANGNVLTLTSHSAAPDFQFTLSAHVIQQPGSKGQVSVENSLQLTPEQVVALDLEDAARMEEFRKFCERSCQPEEGAEAEFVYTCGAGETSFTVDPYGNMQMCQLSRRHSYSLKDGGEFKEGWNEFFPRLRSRKWQHNDACRKCNLMPLCGNCPGAAEMETGDIEGMIPHFCEITHLRAHAVMGETSGHRRDATCCLGHGKLAAEPERSIDLSHPAGCGSCGSGVKMEAAGAPPMPPLADAVRSVEHRRATTSARLRRSVKVRSTRQDHDPTSAASRCRGPAVGSIVRQRSLSRRPGALPRHLRYRCVAQRARQVPRYRRRRARTTVPSGRRSSINWISLSLLLGVEPSIAAPEITQQTNPRYLQATAMILAFVLAREVTSNRS